MVIMVNSSILKSSKSTTPTEVLVSNSVLHFVALS